MKKCSSVGDKINDNHDEYLAWKEGHLVEDDDYDYVNHNDDDDDTLHRRRAAPLQSCRLVRKDVVDTKRPER